MPKEIVLVDYKLGNLFSIKQAIESFGVETTVTDNPAIVSSARALVLPGVGSFERAMNYLAKAGLTEALVAQVNRGVPLLGVCLGMQLLFSFSEEFGRHAGLNILKGAVRRFPAQDQAGNKVRVPNVGWQRLALAGGDSKTTGHFSGPLLSDKDFYFVHSYYVHPEEQDVVAAYSDYCGTRYCAAVRSKNILATQFHPEKSGTDGLRLIQAWINSIEW